MWRSAIWFNYYLIGRFGVRWWTHVYSFHLQFCVITLCLEKTATSTSQSLKILKIIFKHPKIIYTSKIIEKDRKPVDGISVIYLQNTKCFVAFPYLLCLFENFWTNTKKEEENEKLGSINMHAWSKRQQKPSILRINCRWLWFVRRSSMIAHALGGLPSSPCHHTLSFITTFCFCFVVEAGIFLFWSSSPFNNIDFKNRI